MTTIQALGKVTTTPKGDYSGSTQYERLDVVTYNGSSYIATQSTKGNLPTNTTYWQLMASKGDPGNQGVPGIKGDTGNPGGAPLAAASTSAMTDTTKVYVNTTDGHWYWYDGDSWEDGGVYQASSFPEVDNIRIGYDGVTYSSAGDSVRANDEISQNILNKNKMYLLDSYPDNDGFPKGDGTWGNLNQGYKTKFIPVKPGDLIYINVLDSLDSNSSYNGFITDDNPSIVNGATINYVTGTSRNSLRLNFQIVPATAKYMYLVTKYGANNPHQFDLYINDINMINPLILTDKSIDERIANSIHENLIHWIPYAFGTTVGSKPFVDFASYSSIRKSSNNFDKRNYDRYVLTDGTFKTQLILYNDNYEVTSTIFYSLDKKIIPKNTNYKLLIQNAADPDTDISSLTDEYINSKVQVVDINYYNKINDTIQTKWCALGDSITQGYYSYLDDEDVPHSATTSVKNWVKLVSDLNNWILTNKGVGGQGYIDPVNSGTQQKGYEYVDTLDFSDYNLVTLAYGINDWKGNQVVGNYTDSSENPTTVCGAMKNCIEHIMNSNPECKIIVILPFNCVGYSFDYGDKSTNYALGYAFSNSGTLETFAQKMIEVCNYYGIEYIDGTHYSVINRENLRTLLPDGVHPSLKCHELIAKEMSKKINA